MTKSSHGRSHPHRRIRQAVERLESRLAMSVSHALAMTADNAPDIAGHMANAEAIESAFDMRTVAPLAAEFEPVSFAMFAAGDGAEPVDWWQGDEQAERFQLTVADTAHERSLYLADRPDHDGTIELSHRSDPIVARRQAFFELFPLDELPHSRVAGRARRREPLHFAVEMNINSPFSDRPVSDSLTSHEPRRAVRDVRRAAALLRKSSDDASAPEDGDASPQFFDLVDAIMNAARIHTVSGAGFSDGETQGSEPGVKPGDPRALPKGNDAWFRRFGDTNRVDVRMRLRAVTRFAEGGDEGGVIELAAARGATSHASQATGRLASPRPPAGPGGSVPMDTGIGLFQAFDLAHTPEEAEVGPRGMASDPAAAVHGPVGPAEGAPKPLEGSPITPIQAVLVPVATGVAWMLADDKSQPPSENPPGNSHRRRGRRQADQ